MVLTLYKGCGTFQQKPSEALMNTNSKWIWPECQAGPDQYGEFYQAFEYLDEKAEFRISADSNYAVYVNGQLAASGQYPDYPHYKVFDTIDLTPFCTRGINHLAVVVWYYGISNYSYVVGKAAVRYELWLNELLTACSDEHTLSRISLSYRSGYCKTITGQLGLSFWYDLTKEDDWMMGKLQNFASSRIVDQQLRLYPRPIPKFEIKPPFEAKLIQSDAGKHLLFDLGCESVGYLRFRLYSSTKQNILIAYGEHISDGGVRRLIGGRDFSVEVTLCEGENSYMNPFRRLGLRYLEIFCEEPVQFEWIGICPAEYPVKRMEKHFSNPQRQRIYEVCVRTLELCMHDHYEDTPWREQGLYAMDSRNQMLCGYDAFQEYAFPRANLLLMSKDNRQDDLLSICFPNADELTIPSFSLHYFTSVYEYTVCSGDQTLIRELYPKLISILNVFVQRLENGLLPNWTDRYHWNFYEWSDGLSGQLLKETKPCKDAALNCLFVIALQRMQVISGLLNIPDKYSEMEQRVRKAIRQTFYDPADGSMRNSTLDERRSVLVNALGILCGAIEGTEAEKLAAKLVDETCNWTAATLSMVCFQYDALLKVNKEKYRSWILNDIDSKYQKMLDAGATSVWETEEGETAFENAGSLCHAWSSMPVYYYHLLNA